MYPTPAKVFHWAANTVLDVVFASYAQSMPSHVRNISGQGPPEQMGIDPGSLNSDWLPAGGRIVHHHVRDPLFHEGEQCLPLFLWNPLQPNQDP